ncbi:hypothetical protein V6N13_005301 [Hibiscus sabdariffa]
MSRRQGVTKEKRTQGSRYHPKGRSKTSGGARRGEEYYRQQKEESDRRQSGECFNCGKKGHFTRNCRLPRRRTFQRNMATTKEENSEVMLEASINEEEWDAEAGFSVGVEQEELVEDMVESSFVATTYSRIDYKDEEELEEDMEKPALTTTMKSVVFDEASSWWSPQRIEFSEPHDLEEVSKDNKECEAIASDPSEEIDRSTSKDKSPWKMGIHQSTSEELRLSQIEVDELAQELRRSTRCRQPNPRLVQGLNHFFANGRWIIRHINQAQNILAGNLAKKVGRRIDKGGTGFLRLSGLFSNNHFSARIEGGLRQLFDINISRLSLWGKDSWPVVPMSIYDLLSCPSNFDHFGKLCHL